MAGKCRIKVLLDNALPFWMFVDVHECPFIADIERKIQNRCTNVQVESLWLDGCILPPREPSELLRDNDEVNVKIQECIELMHGSPANKKDSKKNQADEGIPGASETPTSFNGQEKETVDILATKTKKKKQKEKEKSKKDKKKRKRDDSSDEESSPVTHTSLLSKANGHDKHKKHKANDSIEQNNTNISSNSKSSPLSGHDVIPANEQTGKGETGTTSINNKQESVKPLEVTPNSSYIAGAPNSEKKKRRRRKRKGSHRESPPQDASKDLAPSCPEPAPLRLPKWNQPQSKKIVFSSDDDGNLTSLATAVTDQPANEATANTSKISSGVRISDGSGTWSAVNKNIDKAAQFIDSSNYARNGQHVCSAANDESMSSVSGRDSVEVSMISSTNGTGLNGTTEMNICNLSTKTDDAIEEFSNSESWSANGHFQQTSIECQTQRVGSREEPVCYKKSAWDYTHSGGQHQALQPNLAEHLKMSPQERGVEMPPYVRARRLPNGAMVYTRNRAHESGDHADTQMQIVSKAKRPCKQSASPRELNKQQQLASVLSNKSIIIQNSPLAKAGADRGISEKGDGLSRQEAAGDNVVILTPIGREYSLFPDLTAAPKAGDTIAYKVLEMGEDYTPGISDFKEAEVLGYDAGSQVVTVKPVINEFNAGKRKPGRFDLPEEDTQEEQVLDIELSSMFEPKLMTSA